MTTIAILVEGTFGGDWALPGSPFRLILESAGIVVVRFEGWTGNVDGVPNVLERGKHRDWIGGSYGFEYLVTLLRLRDPLARIVAIEHSHGLNVVLYALERGAITLERNISICSPVRADMQAPAAAAVKYIGRWRHVAAQGWDFWQWSGEFFDGQFRIDRERKWVIPGASNVENVVIPGIGHSGLLTDPKFLDLWKTDGMIDFLLAGQSEAVI